MAIGPPARRTEDRTPRQVLVELCSFENFSYELAYTVDVSKHGARVLTKNPWQANQRLTVRLVRGDLSSRARVAYCRSVDASTFAIGLELGQPAATWTESEGRSI